MKLMNNDYLKFRDFAKRSRKRLYGIINGDKCPHNAFLPSIDCEAEHMMNKRLLEARIHFGKALGTVTTRNPYMRAESQRRYQNKSVTAEEVDTGEIEISDSDDPALYYQAVRDIILDIIMELKRQFEKVVVDDHWFYQHLQTIVMKLEEAKSYAGLIIHNTAQYETA